MRWLLRMPLQHEAAAMISARFYNITHARAISERHSDKEI